MSRDRRAAVADCHGRVVVASSRVHVARVLGIGGGLSRLVQNRYLRLNRRGAAQRSAARRVVSPSSRLRVCRVYLCVAHSRATENVVPLERDSRVTRGLLHIGVEPRERAENDGRASMLLLCFVASRTKMTTIFSRRPVPQP